MSWSIEHPIAVPVGMMQGPPRVLRVLPASGWAYSTEIFSMDIN
jgi:hypothetical protein